MKEFIVTERLVEKVWYKEVRDIAMYKLCLNEEPTITFKDKDEMGSAAMCVRYTCDKSSTTITKGYRYIIDTSAIYNIDVCIDNIQMLLDNHHAKLVRVSKRLAVSVIKQALLHECRHLWQAQTMYYLGRPYDIQPTDGGGYGTRYNECDANDYALSMARTHKERVVFWFQKLYQNELDVSGTSNAFKDACIVLKKEFTPRYMRKAI